MSKENTEADVTQGNETDAQIAALLKELKNSHETLEEVEEGLFVKFFTQPNPATSKKPEDAPPPNTDMQIIMDALATGRWEDPNDGG